MKKPDSFLFRCAACLSNHCDDDYSPKDEVKTLNNNFNEFSKTNQVDRDSFKESITQILVDFRSEVSCIEDMKSDIIACSKLIYIHMYIKL